MPTVRLPDKSGAGSGAKIATVSEHDVNGKKTCDDEVTSHGWGNSPTVVSLFTTNQNQNTCNQEAPAATV